MKFRIVASCIIRIYYLFNSKKVSEVLAMIYRDNFFWVKIISLDKRQNSNGYRGDSPGK